MVLKIGELSKNLRVESEQKSVLRHISRDLEEVERIDFNYDPLIVGRMVGGDREW